ncbi:lipopolysaccharide assembly protein LapA domain-containing protein [Shewanella sp. C32]|uniref:Probable lipopolysaccharide assembly protein A n=1 Tax=Shewanella electrica TaxID=515560 RepID=A0ABT2FNL9_9GAMM|nr:lipopolysaccharide assembly protein LapA domain-containing protein [Shewanella electrica]MCH1926476.1 lipopolysaccharide assembly protein LapA domain-containing protein [Shewanella electrica]MCS4557932.1 lipopolysaccharide assembly protein LapA domain-containing protein [Shewanella electrica]
MKSFIVTVIVALLFIVALIFGARNEQLVTINYFVVQGEYRLPFVLAVVFFAGFVSCWIVAFAYILRLKLSLKRARRRLMSLESAQQELNS